MDDLSRRDHHDRGNYENHHHELDGHLMDDPHLDGHLKVGRNHQKKDDLNSDDLNRQKMVYLMQNYRGHLGVLMDGMMNYLQA